MITYKYCFFAVDCKPGYYIDGSSCSPCRYGTYQPEHAQSSCKSCDGSKNTTYTASESKDDCKGKLVFCK